MSKSKMILLLLIIVLVVIQFLGPARTNPPLKADSAITAELQVPDNVMQIFRRSCFDCHSDETVWPWYSYVAPVSWLVAHDVNEGRRHVNFSRWAEYSPRKKQKALEEICEEVEDGAMPLKAYLWLHSGAKLSAADVEAICTWSKQTLQQVYGISETDEGEHGEGEEHEEEEHRR